MRILNRYVLKEHAGPLGFALSSLTSLMLLNYIAKQFGSLVGKGLPWTVIGEFFLLSLPFTMAMTLPMAVLVATLYAFSRLAAENEITALKASGIGLPSVLIPVLIGASVLSLAMIGFNDQVLPRANHRLRVLQGDIARKKPTFALREQVINEVSPGRLYLRPGHLDPFTNRMREVVIYDLSNPTRRRTIYADSGSMGLTANRSDLILTLHHGYMQEIDKATPQQLQRLFYITDHIRVRGVGNQLERSTGDNFKSDREMSICELQQQVTDAERAVRRAELELERAVIGATRIALGKTPPDTAIGPIEPGPSLGRMYCALVKNVLPSTAEAQGLGPRKRPSPAQAKQTPAPADTGLPLKMRAMARAQALSVQLQRPTIVPPKTPAPTPMPLPPVIAGATQIPADQRLAAQNAVNSAQLMGTIDAARTRLADGERTRDAYIVEIQKKFAISTACVVFVLIGAPVALRFPRGGVGLVIGVSLSVFALYYIGLIGGESLGDRDVVPPALAMWLANIVLTVIGLVLLARMGREGSTSRGGDAGEFREMLRTQMAKFARKVGLPLERRRRA